ncbi:MAG: hypothetical protein KDJ22_18765, partial [Candidatus Competibacteraceae bacterium]|nr:hypothetical protein [Candidatus Competibacteraceae bacterium]
NAPNKPNRRGQPVDLFAKRKKSISQRCISEDYPPQKKCEKRAARALGRCAAHINGKSIKIKVL